MTLKPIPQHDGEDRERGRVPSLEGTSSPYSHGWSRRFNPVEYSAVAVAIEQELEEKTELLRKEASEKFLAFFRGLVEPYDFTNHRVWISAGMGVASVYVTDLRSGEESSVEYMPDSCARGVYLLLQEISQSLDWDWAGYLDRKILSKESIA